MASPGDIGTVRDARDVEARPFCRGIVLKVASCYQYFGSQKADRTSLATPDPGRPLRDRVHGARARGPQKCFAQLRKSAGIGACRPDVGRFCPLPGAHRVHIGAADLSRLAEGIRADAQRHDFRRDTGVLLLGTPNSPRPWNMRAATSRLPACSARPPVLPPPSTPIIAATISPICPTLRHAGTMAPFPPRYFMMRFLEVMTVYGEESWMVQNGASC